MDVDSNAGTEEQEPVPWRDLKRMNAHRTSRPTDDLVRRLVGEIAAATGRAPFVDAVLFAALRIAQRGELQRLVDEILLIESQSYPPNRVPHDPGS